MATSEDRDSAVLARLAERRDALARSWPAWTPRTLAQHIEHCSELWPQRTYIVSDGKSWTYSLAINDNYFEAMAPALASDGVSNSAAPINISAGDGSPDAFQRIRTNDDQAATVAAPLSEQGWEVIDQLNRAMAGKPADNFVAAPRLFDHADIGTDGGPQNTYIPNDDYQKHYEAIWGVK